MELEVHSHFDQEVSVAAAATCMAALHTHTVLPQAGYGLDMDGMEGLLHQHRRRRQSCEDRQHSIPALQQAAHSELMARAQGGALWRCWAEAEDVMYKKGRKGRAMSSHSGARLTMLQGPFFHAAG